MGTIFDGPVTLPDGSTIELVEGPDPAGYGGDRMDMWEPVPLDDITDTGTITHEGYPVPLVLCPCGARPLIDDAGPGWCSRCGRLYAMTPEGRIVREAAR